MPPRRGWRRRSRPAHPALQALRTVVKRLRRPADSSWQTGAPALPWRGLLPRFPRWSVLPFHAGHGGGQLRVGQSLVQRVQGAMIISIISASLAMMLSWKLSGVSGRESCSWAATQLAKHPTSRSCLTTMLRVLGHPKKTEAKVSQIMSVP